MVTIGLRSLQGKGKGKEKGEGENLLLLSRSSRKVHEAENRYAPRGGGDMRAARAWQNSSLNSLAFGGKEKKKGGRGKREDYRVHNDPSGLKPGGGGGGNRDRQVVGAKDVSLMCLAYAVYNIKVKVGGRGGTLLHSLLGWGKGKGKEKKKKV